jgi:homoserine dehydrogenase
MKTTPLRVALLGFGTVGGSVARILTERPELADRLQLTHIFNRGVARKRAAGVP